MFTYRKFKQIFPILYDRRYLITTIWYKKDKDTPNSASLSFT